MKTLPELVDMLQDELAGIDMRVGSYSDDPQGYHARLRVELEQLAAKLSREFGASGNERWDGAAIRLAGIRASSTSGLHGAFRNWITAARKRIEKETAR